MSGSDVSYEYFPLRSSPSGHSGDEFRLLVLLPGQDDAEIQCEIQHASLDGPPQYEALSYTWGDPKGEYSLEPYLGDPSASYSIKVDEGYLKVGYNLLSALMQLRHDTSPRTLWIDAICINQDDTKERSYQVKAMARIYSGASRVIAWLGEHDEYTDLAFDTLEELVWSTKASLLRYCSNVGMPSVDDFDLASVIEMEIIGLSANFKTRDIIKALHLLPSINFEAMLDLEAAALIVFGDSRVFARYLVSGTEGVLEDARFSERIIALQQVFEYRTYWKRLWIVQELVFAAEITFICGRRSVDLRLLSLTDLIRFGVYTETGNSILLPALDHKAVEELSLAVLSPNFVDNQRSKRKASLGENISLYSFMACSDPRDYIYALLNISAPINIPIDYQLSTNAIFTQATRQIIQQDNSIDIIFERPYLSRTAIFNRPYISRTARLRPLDAEMPSWVPRYETPYFDGNLTTNLRCKAGGLVQDNVFKSQFATQGNDLVLQLNGYYGSKIEQASPFLMHEAGDKKMWETIMALKSQLVRNSVSKLGRIWHTIRPHSQQMNKSADAAEEETFTFWNTLAMDLYSAHGKHTGYTERMTKNRELSQYFRQDIETALSSNSAPPDRLNRLLRFTLDRKKFCFLSGGQMALVNGDADIGDVLFIARGASVPLIIRPTDPSFRLGKRRADDPDPEFTFVGGAYMAGVMDGEVVQEMDKMNFKDESIRLV